MNPLLALARWLDVRPHQYRTFSVSALGAFLVMSFSVTARSLREAFFINEFAVESLPYVIIVTALISLPWVGAFSRLMGRYESEAVYKRLISMLRRLPSSASNLGLHGGRNLWCTALC
jgi:ATP/ADP translocase